MSNVQLEKNLRTLRKSHNYTQQQIADKLNISRQAYSNYETGQRYPDMNTLFRLTQFYGISLEQLFAQSCTPNGFMMESSGPYTAGLVLDTADTLYLSREEVSLVMQYRDAAKDDKRIVKKILNIPEKGAEAGTEK